jgi:regulator of extracellular matrix RemA (YlzA/DUF370 family)
MFRFLVAAAALAALVAPASSAQSRLCAQRADLLRQLDAKYDERPVAMGIADNGRLLEVVASEDGSTFTVLVTTPGGLSCLMATGQSWQNRFEVAQLPGA